MYLLLPQVSCTRCHWYTRIYVYIFYSLHHLLNLIFAFLFDKFVQHVHANMHSTALFAHTVQACMHTVNNARVYACVGLHIHICCNLQHRLVADRWVLQKSHWLTIEARILAYYCKKNIGRPQPKEHWLTSFFLWLLCTYTGWHLFPHICSDICSDICSLTSGHVAYLVQLLQIYSLACLQ